jgi:hypothetical protein
MHSWLHDDAGWARRDAAIAAAAAAAGLFPDDEDWFPGATMPGSSWYDGRPVVAAVGVWSSHDAGHVRGLETASSGGGRGPADAPWSDALGRHWPGAAAALCSCPEDDGAGAWYTAYGNNASRGRPVCDCGRAAPAAGWCSGGGGGGDFLPWGGSERMDHL